MPTVDLAPIQRRRMHRTVFAAAGIYNISWGIFVALNPQWLFRFAKMPPANYPDLFVCLGMVIGLYGVLYLDVARRPEHGWLVAAVGLAGKILGPIGVGILILRGTWTFGSAVMCLTNDLVWWLPFAIYLRDSWPHFRATL